MLRSEDEFINACLGKVLPGEIDFDFPLETIVAFWFNRCVHKGEALRLIVDDIICYFKDKFAELSICELPEPEAKLNPKQLKLL